MRSLVEDLLLLSKVGPTSHRAASAVNLAELLDTIAQRLQPVVRQREQQLVLHPPRPSSPPATPPSWSASSGT